MEKSYVPDPNLLHIALQLVRACTLCLMTNPPPEEKFMLRSSFLAIASLRNYQMRRSLLICFGQSAIILLCYVPQWQIAFHICIIRSGEDDIQENVRERSMVASLKQNSISRRITTAYTTYRYPWSNISFPFYDGAQLQSFPPPPKFCMLPKTKFI